VLNLFDGLKDPVRYCSIAAVELFAADLAQCIASRASNGSGLPTVKYLFSYGLFNYAVSSSVCTVPNDTVINE
jgi:hypothetical protein